MSRYTTPQHITFVKPGPDTTPESTLSASRRAQRALLVLTQMYAYFGCDIAADPGPRP